MRGLWQLLYRLALAVLARDFGIGTSLRPLGPVTVRIDAPREIVFDVIAGPYLGRTPRALQGKLKVLERRGRTVIAEHYTRTGRIVAVTVESVRFYRPQRVELRLLRGPVPHAFEAFDLGEVGAGTVLDYKGELATSLWAVGRWWGRAVGDRWEAAVRDSLGAIKSEAERRAR